MNTRHTPMSVLGAALCLATGAYVNPENGAVAPDEDARRQQRTSLARSLVCRGTPSTTLAYRPTTPKKPPADGE